MLSPCTQTGCLAKWSWEKMEQNVETPKTTMTQTTEEKD